MTLKIGSRYVASTVLGRGAMGTVWRGEGPQGPVALKVLRPHLAHDPDLVARFVQERSALLRLDHPNIVRVRDLVADGDVLALVMDLVEGADLRSLLRTNGPLAPRDAVTLVSSVADALAAAHSCGVVHRDVKPENVLTRPDNGGIHPLLTDFGVARLSDAPGMTSTNMVVGTPNYLAPELYSGTPVTSAVDVYATGILLYELIAGQTPFAADNAFAVMRRHTEESPRRLAGVPERLWGLLERCLAKDPTRRPTAAELAALLRADTESTPVVPLVAAGVGAGPPPPAVAPLSPEATAFVSYPGLAGGLRLATSATVQQRPVPARRRRRLVLLSSAALLLVGVVAGSAVLLDPGTEPEPGDRPALTAGEPALPSRPPSGPARAASPAPSKPGRSQQVQTATTPVARPAPAPTGRGSRQAPVLTRTTGWRCGGWASSRDGQVRNRTCLRLAGPLVYYRVQAVASSAQQVNAFAMVYRTSNLRAVTVASCPFALRPGQQQTCTPAPARVEPGGYAAASRLSRNGRWETASTSPAVTAG